MRNTMVTVHPDQRWKDKNFVYEICIQHLEDIGRNDLVDDLGYVLTGYTKRQLVKVSVNGINPLIEQAERLSNYSPCSTL